jgi:hypothetical protein
LLDGDAFSKALAVVNDESFKKGGTKSSSPPLGIEAKQSLGMRTITIVDFWSTTRATSADVMGRFSTKMGAT